MTIDFNVRGSMRKDLGKDLSEHTGMESHYNGVAKQTYSIGDLTITREGFLDIPEDWPQEDIKDLVAFLKAKGYTPVEETEDSEVEITEGTFTVTVPKDSFSDEAIRNLDNLLVAKGDLMQKALGAETMAIQEKDGDYVFAWIQHELTPQEATAITHFINAICEMAKTQKRIAPTSKPVENEKYAFRCFLLRLGFIGDEFKADRKVLLQNLSGSTAFKGGAK